MKKKKIQKKSQLGAIIVVIVVVAVSAGVIYFYNQQKVPENNMQGVTSGPFSIDKTKYRLGDNVFMVVTGLASNDTGKIIVHDPKGGTFTQIPFNGTMKSDFNYFFKPNTERAEKLCTPQDLVGNWTIIFQGTHYRSIPFEITNEWVNGSQKEIKPINPC